MLQTGFLGRQRGALPKGGGGIVLLVLPYVTKWASVTKGASVTKRGLILPEIQTFDDQTPLSYLAIRQWSKDIKHLIPRTGSLRFQG